MITPKPFFLLGALIIGPLAFSGIDLAGKEPRSQSSSSLVEKEYNLLSRLPVKHKTYYSYTDRFAHLSATGRVERWETETGYYTQEVIRFWPDGEPVFRVIRNHTQLRTESAEPKSAELIPLDFGERFTYEVCFGENYDYLPIDTSHFPKTLPGFMMFENIIHSHQFAILATKTHGGLDKLRKIGDTVTIPDSGKGGVVEFPGLLSITLVRGKSTMTFLGLSQYRAEPAALLSWDVPLQFPNISGGEGTGRATGLIWISLRDGEVLRGYLRQTTIHTLKGPNGAVTPANVDLEGWLEKIPQADYPTSAQ